MKRTDEAEMVKQLIEGTVGLILEETEIEELKKVSDAELLAAGVLKCQLPATKLRIQLVLEMVEHVKRFERPR